MTKVSQLSLVATMIVMFGCSENKVPIEAVENNPSSEISSQQTIIVEPETTIDYKEGIHYRLVHNINVGDLKTPFIIEYFWLSCGHCQKLEQPLQAFKKQNPNVGFTRKHAVLGERWVMDARLYYALEETNNSQLFDEFFSLYTKGITEESFSQFFVKNNIDKEAFLKVAGNSEAILAKMKESLQEMSDNKMTSVPSLVINGKYLIVKADDGDYFKLVNYLLSK